MLLLIENRRSASAC